MQWHVVVILNTAVYMVMAAGVVHNCFRDLYVSVRIAIHVAM